MDNQQVREIAEAVFKAISRFERADIGARRSFAAHVLFKQRSP